MHILVAGGVGTYELYLNGEKTDAELKSMWGVIRPTEQVFMARDEDNDVTIALADACADHVYAVASTRCF